MIDQLWNPLIAALSLREDDRKHRVDSSWGNDAVDMPAGKLSNLLMKDPSAVDRKPGQGFPAAWLLRNEQLLALPGDMRRHALVMLGFQITWLFAVDPDWTTAHLLGVVDNKGEDGEALWDGILWAARSPQPNLYERLKPALFNRAMSPTRRHAEARVIGGFLLIGWGGGDPNATPPKQLVTNGELREILVGSDEELRGQVLWQIERWSADLEGEWRARLIPFLTDVWPNHRAVRTSRTSVRLVDLAVASGDLFPQVVRAILARLVPVRGGMLRISMLCSEADDHPARVYPAAMLDLLWAILAEDAALWPHKIEEVLNIVADAPETQGDPRLSELRRRRSG